MWPYDTWKIRQSHKKWPNYIQSVRCEDYIRKSCKRSYLSDRKWWHDLYESKVFRGVILVLNIVWNIGPLGIGISLIFYWILYFESCSFSSVVFYLSLISSWAEPQQISIPHMAQNLVASRSHSPTPSLLNIPTQLLLAVQLLSN